MNRLRNITIQGRFYPQCQGCKELVLKRNGYDNVWNCCYYYNCGYSLQATGSCVGNKNHEELKPLDEDCQGEYLGHA